MPGKRASGIPGELADSPGNLGGTLARRLAKLGRQVSIASSRGPESLTSLAAEIGATPVSVVDAANGRDIVIISIPTKAVADLPRGLFSNVPSSVVVIDPGNYHPHRLTFGISTPLLSGRIGECRAEEEARIRRDGAPAQPVKRAEGCATDLGGDRGEPW